MSLLEEMKPLSIIAAVVLAVGIGYVVGISQTTTTIKVQYVQETIKEEIVSVKDKKEHVPSHNRAIKKSKRIHKQQPLVEEENAQVDPYAMAEGIDTLVRLANADGPYDFQGVNSAKQTLLNLAKRDQHALDELLSAYADNLQNKHVQGLLFQVVSQLKEPKVEALAQELALSGDRTSQIAGFDLLGALKMPSPNTLELSVETLQEEQDDQVLVLSALHALVKVPLSMNQNRDVVTLLSTLAVNDNEAIRSESILTLAKWAKNEEDLSAVIEALSSETIDDRVSAAMALERTAVVGPNLKEHLLEKIQDEKELWEVRSMSANALERFNLSSDEFARLQVFRAQQVGGVTY